MAYSKKTYTGDGVTKLFTVTFPYIDPSHVTVLVNGVSTAFTFQSKYVIELSTAPGVGAIIQLVRNSNPQARLVDFQDDSMATEQLLNLNSDQLLFVAQEALDNTLEGTVVEQVQALADSALASAVAAALSASSISLPIPVASGGTGASTPDEARTALGLGTVATRDVGTSSGNLVEVLTGGKLPALDGSNLTVVPRMPGAVVQEVISSSTAMMTSSALIPWDDTVPQATEGFQVLTGTITPSKLGNKLVIEFNLNSSCSSPQRIAAALFRNSAVDAVYTVANYTQGAHEQMIGRWEMIVTSLTSINFTLRAGSNSGSTTVNGESGGRSYGGTLVSYLRLTEVVA